MEKISNKIKAIEKMAKRWGYSKKYVTLLYDALESVNCLKSFRDILMSGYSKDVQIQFLNDNFTEKKLKMSDIDFWIDDNCRGLNPVFLTSFKYKSKRYLLVYQN